MHAPVKNHAAALCLRVSPVARDTAGTVNTGLNGKNTTELAGLCNLLRNAEILVPTAVLMHRKDGARALGGCDHLFEISGAKRDRLLADGNLARFHNLNANLLVLIVRDCDRYNINGLVGKQLLKRAVCVNTVFLSSLVALRLNIVYTCKLYNTRDFLQSLRVPAAHAAIAHDCYSYYFRHNKLDSSRF